MRRNNGTDGKKFRPERKESPMKPGSKWYSGRLTGAAFLSLAAQKQFMKLSLESTILAVMTVREIALQ
jgi:hypothetical protein